MRQERSAYDLVVIGGGSAGLTVAAFAGRVGARVLLVDRERLGGDCLWAGCVPSKALIRCGTVAHTARRSGDCGVLADHTVDFPGAMAHVRQAMQRIAAGESPEALAARGVETAFGGARFVGPRRLGIADREVRGRGVVIATGARPSPPAIPGLAEAGYLDHVSLWSLSELPRRLAVVGGGPVGVEMAQAFARLGTQVMLVQRGERILPRDDAELAGLLSGYLEEELTILCGATVVGARRRGTEKVLTVRTTGAERDLARDEVLVATGRRPALEGLDLEAGGVRASERGIEVDASLRTSAAGVFACGDCTGGPAVHPRRRGPGARRHAQRALPRPRPLRAHARLDYVHRSRARAGGPHRGAGAPARREGPCLSLRVRRSGWTYSLIAHWRHPASGATWAEIARLGGCDWRTARKYLTKERLRPPRYRPRPPREKVIEPYVDTIDAALRASEAQIRATTIYERLASEHGYPGSNQRVKEYVAHRRPEIAAELGLRSGGEMHRRFTVAPGAQAQVDSRP